MGVFENKFSWSKSRDEKFRECPRQYYYHHYGAWGGWDASADPKVRELYILKNLKSRHMWVGEIVHHTIENALKAYVTTQKMDVEKMLSEMTARMRNEFRSSRDKNYRKVKKAVGLFEHEYDVKLADSKWVEIHETAKRCVTNFGNIIFPRLVKPVPVQNWKLIETLQEFDFEGTLIYVKIDFAILVDASLYSEWSKVALQNERFHSEIIDGEFEGRAGSTLVIIDWKTGKTEDVDNQIQLDCYGLFSRDHFKLPATSIQTIECNVNIVKDNIHQMIEAKMDFAKHYLRNSIAGMKRVLKDEAKNIAEEKNFPFTENEMTCRYCNFKKVCAKYT